MPATGIGTHVVEGRDVHRVGTSSCAGAAVPLLATPVAVRVPSGVRKDRGGLRRTVRGHRHCMPSAPLDPRSDDVARTRPEDDAGTRDGATRTRAALAGLAAVAAAVGTTELAAGVLRWVPSLVLEVGDVVIDSVPGPVERAAIALLGTADKPVLVTGVLLVSALLGAVLGVLSLRRSWLGTGGFLAFAALGAAAALADPRHSLAGALVGAGSGAVVGVLALHRLLALGAPRSGPATSTDSDTDSDTDRDTDRDTGTDTAPETGTSTDASRPDPVVPRSEVDRRRFLALTGGTAAAGVLAGAGGWLLSGRERFEAARAAVRLPRPFRTAPAVPAGADLEIPGLTPLYVPNEQFFRIDTALRVPVVDLATWRLEVRGRVERPFSLTYDELLALPHVEADITLSCVSNEVGGDLVGNARWQGVPLTALLERAGVQPGGTQVIGRSVDGFTAGFPTVTAMDVEEAMVAVAMNGVPLPAEHGFPARLVVPGLYGYVSATKWLSAIELTGFEEEGYWIPRGWAKEGPVKTATRIDVARADAPGRGVIAGVAWAPTRGVRGVEVRVDDGPWQPATLAAQLDVDCWRLWYLPWDAPPGRHEITARATDGLGEVQTDERTPVAPDGASGYPVVSVVVET